MDWVPEYVRDVSVADHHLKGYVSSKRELKELIEIHSRWCNCEFVYWDNDQSKKEKTTRKLMWSYKHVGVLHSEESQDQIHPFVVSNYTVNACQYGKPHYRKPGEKEPKDHSYVKNKKFHSQNTRKIDCPAKLSYRKVTRFNKWSVEIGAGKTKRGRIAKQVNIEEDKDVTDLYFVCLPLEGAHEGHALSVEGGFCKRIKKEVREKIYSLVASGITSTAIVRRVLKHYVLEEMSHPDDVKPSKYDSGYFPRNANITSHIHRALAQGRYSALDIQNLERKIQQWEAADPTANFFFRKCTESREYNENRESSDIADSESSESEEEDHKNTFLFIHQTTEQQLLLRKYGSLVLLDATYKTSKYALPLFMLVVQTNVKFIPVAEFMVERESTECIKEALKIIKEWNPNWKPENFMVDYCNEEIHALEAVFPTADRYLCKFHRLQSWRRWITNSKNALSKEEQDILLSQMESMANAQTENALSEARAEIMGSKLYKENDSVKRYLDNHWMNNTKSWCEAHLKQGIIGRTTTTNGIEALHKSLKHFYLKLQGNGTLATTVEIIIQEFIPDMILEYKRLNFMSCSLYKRYQTNIPNYLHNRPKQVFQKLLKSLCSAYTYSAPGVNELPDGTYEVRSEGDSQLWYHVHLGDDKAGIWSFCECPDYRISRMPCKHMFVIFKYTDKDWDDLSLNFRNSPYITLDQDVLSVDIFDDDIKVEPVEGDELDELIRLMKQQEVEDRNRERKENELKNYDRILSKKKTALHEKLKVIRDMSYDITDVKVLQSVCSALDMSIDLIEKSVKKEHNIRVNSMEPVKMERPSKDGQERALPVRKGRLKKKKKANKGNIIMSPKNDEQDSTNVPLSDSNFYMDSSFVDDTLVKGSDENILTTTSMLNESQRDLQQAFLLVDKIWSHPKNYDIPVAKVYGEIVTDTDIRSLHRSQWLTDKIIDCYLSMVITAECDKGKKIIHVPQNNHE